MESRARSQCNLVMKSLGGFPDFVQKFSDSVVPLFWLEYVSISLVVKFTNKKEPFLFSNNLT